MPDTFASSLADLLDPPAPSARRWATPGEMARAIDPATKQTPALDLIDATLVDIADGAVTQQMVFCSPQTGKSERVVRRNVLWLLEHDPTLRIVIVSYELDTAVRWGRVIKRDLESNPDLGIRLQPDSKAAGRWETEQGGGLYCVGIRGGFTGRPADVLIIDDPLKDRADAESKVVREMCWDFWQNVAKPRARKTILVMTRWHADDLAGRLLEHEPGDWRVLSIPAIAEENDALGREVDEEMESALPREPGYYHRFRSQVSSYVFNSLYQQRPTAAEGNIFKRGDWRFWHTGDGTQITLDGNVADLRDATKFITMDLASSTQTSADFTVASCWAITHNGDLVLLDRKRERVPETDHAAFLAPMRQRWMNPYDVTHIESRMFGTTLVYALGRAGVPIAELKADVNKTTRALPAAGLVRQHRVWLPADASWLDSWLDEHADFPNGTHDDQVDTMAYAAKVVIEHWLPGETAEQERAREPGPSEYVDLMSAKAW